MRVQLSRRSTLKSILAGSLATKLGTAKAVATPAGEIQGVCTLYPQSVEGPFYFDPKLARADITEGRPGTPLTVGLRVIEAGPCTPIAGARVDIWHADTRGVYSGYGGQGDDGRTSAKGETYLRGTQVTDTEGNVTFRTVYPGWYPGRTPHIHVKVFLDDKTLATGQIYFPDDVSAAVYAREAPYTNRGPADTTNATDFIFQSGGPDGGGTVASLQAPTSFAAAPLTAALIIAVDRSGAAAKGGWRSLFFPGR